MKLFKVILPSIALIVVLAFSITIGVYAATDITLTLSSTITFKSPDVKDYVIDCYVKHGTGDAVLKHTYSTIDGIESDGDAWDLNKEGELKYTEREIYTDQSTGATYEIYSPIILKFVIRHKTELPVYAYFKDANDQIITQSQELLSTDGVKLINATFNDRRMVGIEGGDLDSAEYTGGEVSIELALIPNATTIERVVDFKNYNLVITKTPLYVQENATSTGTTNFEISDAYQMDNIVISGNSAQENNIFNFEEMSSGFLPLSGAYPTQNESYPNASYSILNLKAGKTYQISYAGSASEQGRIRYIDSDSDEVVGTVTAGTNAYYTSNSTYNNGFRQGTITAIKDFDLGIMYLATLPNDFDLKVVCTTIAPDSPSQIQSVGEKTKNLFDSNQEFEVFNINGTNRYGYKLPSGLTTITLSATLKEGFVTNSYTLTIASVNDDGTYTSISSFQPQKQDNTTLELDETTKYIIFCGSTSYKQNVQEFIDSYYWQIEEGTVATDYEPYGKYKIAVTTSGKNLYNKDQYPLVDGKYIKYNSGAIVSTQNYKATQELVPIEPNTTYSINYTAGGGNPGIAFYDENEQYISGVKSGVGFTTPSNAKYLRFTVDIGVDVNTVQIEKGTVATDYEPYIEPKTYNIYLDEPLRKLGDYADYIDFKTGKVVRNVQCVFFDGSDDENWLSWGVSANTEGITGFYMYFNHYNLPVYATTVTSSNILPYNGSAWGGRQVGCNITGKSNSPYLMFSIENEYLADTSSKENAIASFRTLLANIGVEFHYTLETSIESEIELPDIDFENVTNITIETGVEPSDATITYWQYYNN